ncbi:MAG: 4,5-DOPA dioxygenase extradiol [Pseudomonadota bacterium]
MQKPAPAIFFGHGSPGNVMEDNDITQCWARLGREIGKPKGIICVSAHWYEYGLSVTAAPTPPTIHDFGGFPEAMYRLRYPASGAPELATAIAARLAPVEVTLDSARGFDHGSWCVLAKVYPQADVPVVQVGMNMRLSPAEHFAIGRTLGTFRDEGYFLMGSGNIVHNLPEMNWQMRADAYDWATCFGNHIRTSIADDRPEDIIDYETQGRDAMLSVPTPDHYLPLLYVMGARRDTDALRFETPIVEYGSLDMTSIVLGL